MFSVLQVANEDSLLPDEDLADISGVSSLDASALSPLGDTDSEQLLPHASSTSVSDPPAPPSATFFLGKRKPHESFSASSPSSSVSIKAIESYFQFKSQKMSELAGGAQVLNDEDFTFGRFVGDEFSKLKDKRGRLDTRRKITDLLYTAQQEELSREASLSNSSN